MWDMYHGMYGTMPARVQNSLGMSLVVVLLAIIVSNAAVRISLQECMLTLLAAQQ